MALVDSVKPSAINLIDAISSDNAIGSDESHQILLHHLKQFLETYNGAYPNTFNPQEDIKQFYFNPHGSHNSSTQKILNIAKAAIHS